MEPWFDHLLLASSLAFIPADIGKIDEADLGMVWRAASIEQIFDHPAPGNFETSWAGGPKIELLRRDLVGGAAGLIRTARVVGSERQISTTMPAPRDVSYKMVMPGCAAAGGRFVSTLSP